MNFIEALENNPYIAQSPTGKQLAFLSLDNLEAFYGGAAGGGKILANDGVVLTPFGWKQGKHLKVGDRINNPDGSTQRIIQIKPEVTLEKWTVCFSDGTKTEVAADHLWLSWKSRKSRKIKNKRVSGFKSAEVIETRELLDWLNRGYSPQIPVCVEQPFNVSTKEKNALDPYLLGVLLGDGCTTGNNMTITCHNDDKDHYRAYFKEKEEVSYKSEKSVRFVGKRNLQIKAKLGSYGLLGKKSLTKFIPAQYLFGYVKDRWALVQGLMDTDGWSAKGKNACYYDTISPQLADGMAQVLRSLGCTVTINKHPAGYKDKSGEYVPCNDSYTLYIRCNNPDKLFRMKRKQFGIFGKNLVQKRVTNVEVGGTITGRCITVSNPNGLYITNDFIVTHNSSCLLMAALQYVDIPGYNALIVRDTLKNLTLADALIPRSQEWLNGKAHWSEQKSKWTFPTGATLTFGYMDGPRDHFNYQGAAFQFIGIDETVAIRENQADYLFSRLRKLNDVDIPLRLRLASNPPSREQIARGAWVKRRYVDSLTRKKDVIFIPSRLEDNPYLDQDSYKLSLDKLDPITRAQLLNGDWETQAAGDFFKREWFKFVDQVPEDEVEHRVRFWDMAATEEDQVKKNKPCYTAGLKMCRTKDQTWYIESVIRFKKKPKDTEQIIRQTADMDGKGVQIRMEMEGGSGGKITIDHYTRYILAGFDFRGGRPVGNKSERAGPFASQLEAGNVLLVKGAWNADFIDEADMFPVGEYKDQIDVAAGAFSVLTPGEGNAPNVYVF